MLLIRKLILPLLAVAGASAQVDEVDVLIVGGGATGSYAAVRLREDYNKTILLVEKAKRLVRLPLTFSNNSFRSEYVTDWFRVHREVMFTLTPRAPVHQSILECKHT